LPEGAEENHEISEVRRAGRPRFQTSQEYKFKNNNGRIYKTIILPVVLYGCETWPLTLREEHTD
jgi:hypothetical protein